MKISRSCVYPKSKIITFKPRGRRRPVLGFTLNRDGVIIKDESIITHLKEYRLTLEFNNAGGTRKLAHYLAIEHKLLPYPVFFRDSLSLLWQGNSI